MKKIAVLGLTGSIGLSVAEVVRNHSQMFHIAFATSHNNHEEMLPLAEEFKIDKIVFTSEDIRSEIRNPGADIFFGKEEVLKILASEHFDVVINAISGSAGLQYTYYTLKSGHLLALANKESLVMAGHLFTDEIKNKRIIPIDSEHSALLQISQGLSAPDIRKIIITASGGPFRELPISEFANIRIQDALQHPTWSMGARITIDSATMFNKGLEVIEAHWLFGLPYEQIEAVVHPQSVIHSLIECSDGSIFAQLSEPSMQLPILYALSYPDHIESDLVKTNLVDLPALTFTAIEPERYPLFNLTREAGKEGGIMPTVLNAANEAAIELFLQSKISFPDISSIVQKHLERHSNIENPGMETILQVNQTVYESVLSSYQ